MIVEVGHFALVLAVVISVAQCVIGGWGGRTGDQRLMSMASLAAIAQCLLLLIAFLALTYAYVTSDFSVANVARNSHTAKPLIYRISGVWGNHEGSMLLWILILAICGTAVAVFGRNLPMRLKSYVLAVQASIMVAFGAFVLFTSNPFARLSPVPLEGSGLNPLLQDPALAFHPPFLYAGYVGFSLAFSFAVAALLEGRIDGAWARWVRPWTLAAWMFLTIGIAMGSWWAYYELGWGGWWFWDPVENASFMPWLAGTALLHSAVVMEKREALKIWTVLLAILTFSLSLMGTFLVRSGVLTSVHAFAVDPARGSAILAIMAFFIGGSLALFAWRARNLRQGGLFAPISREGSLVLNNILLTTATATVLIGTLYPLLLQATTGDKISVGPPYFNLTFGPLMLPLLIAMPFGPLLAWKRGDAVAVSQRLTVAFLLGLVAATAAYAWHARGPWLAPCGIGLGVFVVFGALSDIVYRCKLGSASLEENFRRLWNLPRSVFGGALSHLGVGIMVIGIVATTAYQSEKILVMSPGDVTSIGGYELKFRGVVPSQGPNYREHVGLLEVTRGGSLVHNLYPAKRVYDQPPQPTSEAGIYVSWRGDLYSVLGDEKDKGGYTFRFYFNPLVRLIWMGAVLMFVGGLLSLLDRRLRIGAPKRARAAGEVVAAE